MNHCARVTVVGSSNTDMVVRLPHLPTPGESVGGGIFTMTDGGKGANQAVAAARMGAAVSFIGKIGADDFGRRAMAVFTAENIDTSNLTIDPNNPSGVALISVDAASGENAISIAPGANFSLQPHDIANAELIVKNSDALVCQLEVPLDAVVCALKIAKSHGITTILNPAPAPSEGLSAEILDNVDILIPNETEAIILAGNRHTDAVDAARQLVSDGVPTLILTRGSRGSMIFADGKETNVRGRRAVKVVDTTAAGDCFVGTIAAGLSMGMSLIEAAEFASMAATLSVTIAGAQPSLPKLETVRQALEQVGIN